MSGPRRAQDGCTIGASRHAGVIVRGDPVPMTLLNAVLTLVNVGVLAISVKLYTEIFKSHVIKQIGR